MLHALPKVCIRFAVALCLIGTATLNLNAQSDATPSSAQVNPTTPASVRLTIRAMVIDRDLNVKPLPKFVFVVHAADPGSSTVPSSITTGLDGSAETVLAPGRYQIVSAKPLIFESKQFSW